AFVKAALFLGAGIVLHRLHSVNETWLHGRGRQLRYTGAVFTAAALGLADLPPFGTFLGKGWIDDSARLPWLTAVFLLCSVRLAAGCPGGRGGSSTGWAVGRGRTRRGRRRPTRRRGSPTPAASARR